MTVLDNQNQQMSKLQKNLQDKVGGNPNLIFQNFKISKAHSTFEISA